MNIKDKKVAIITDWLTSCGGAEKVIFSLTKLFPNATVYTSVISREKFPELNKTIIKTTWLQKLPRFIRNKHQFLLLFFPSAFKKLDLSDFDLIISSSSSGFSKCIKKSNKNQKHICYCHTPNRFLYHAKDEYIKSFPLPWWTKWIRIFLPLILNYLEKIDQNSAKKVDYWISNSDFVGKRIKKFYKTNSTTIYPGVQTAVFSKLANIKNKKKYFLAVGRFIPYKKFDLLVKTFANNKLPLKLAGIGPDLDKCKNLAKKLNANNIDFLGFVKDEKLPKLYAEAQAFIFPAEEDFGLTPIEAMSAGTPVVFYNKGGARESVGKLGISFEKQDAESLQKAINKFQNKKIDIQKVKSRGISFDENVFRENFSKFIKDKVIKSEK